MCTGELTESYIRAICKARGFTTTHAGSPALFRLLLLSDRGLESAFSSLDHREIILLHFLNFLKKPVDITVFERLTEQKSNWFSTFNQRYGDVFKHVKTDFIRNGVLSPSTTLLRIRTKKNERKICIRISGGIQRPPPFPVSIAHVSARSGGME